MKEYIYDGSFEGLLTAIFYAYPDKEELQITKQHAYIPSLLFEPLFVATEPDKADRVYNSILTKLSLSTLRNVYYLYLSEVSGVDLLIYQYLKLCYKYSNNVNLAKNNDIIIQVDTYCRRVTLEAHRFKGFVRFKEVASHVFYAKIEPDYYILPLILRHFEERFSNQYFVIHDIKRELAIVYNLKECIIKELTLEEGLLVETHCLADPFEKLFKCFYTSTTIKERANLHQQLRYMPKRYHKHLIEL